MGKKYIIELEDGEHLYKTTINALGNPVMRAAEKVPYTELDLEQVKKEAYEKGYHAGYAKYLNKSYEDGLNDAWEVARKLEFSTNNGGLPTDTIMEVFGTLIPNRVLRDFTAAEVIEKLQAYEQKQDEKKKTDYYFEMMKDAIETSAKEYGMSLDEVAAVLDKMRACGS